MTPDEIFARARPSIVSIRSGTSTGTGFYATASGVIVTNAHVVGYAQDVRIIDVERREFAARVIAADLRLDIALLAADQLRAPLPLGDSRAVRVGERVLAIGDPLGLPATATGGIISSVDRTSRRTGVTYLQTDAALNAGNSGGPLLDDNGRVVGVNTMIAMADGVGFAIPVDAFRAQLERFEPLPANLPVPTYACSVCERAFETSERWCAGCGSMLGMLNSVAAAGHMRAGALTVGLLEALGFDAAASRVTDGVWRLEANGVEVWMDALADGAALAFSSRLGMLPVRAPLPVLRFLTAANDRSIGPCRLRIDGDDIIVIEVVELTDFVDPAQIAITLGQLVAIAAELQPLLASEFGVEPPLHRFVTGGFSL
jgi:hypothetical protein